VHGQGFRFLGDVESTKVALARAPTSAQALVREILTRPVLAVLPFETEPAAAADAYFADGLAEELITELSSWRWFPILRGIPQVVLAGLTGDKDLAREARATLEKMGGPMDERYLAASYPFQETAHADMFRKGLDAAAKLRR
jgi:hypothetical protein